MSTSAAFLRAVALTECAPEHADRAFTAQPQPVPWPKAYGGDTVAQSVAAAIRTVDDDRVLHSVHSTFLRGVDVSEPVRYEVEAIRDGRGFSTRHVRGHQHGKLAFMATASFHVPEDFPEHGPAMPDVPAPETLPSTADYLAGEQGADIEYWSHDRSFDMRHVPGPVYVRVEGERTPHQAVWVRAFAALEDDPITHQLAIAYVCDYTILEPVLRVLDLPWRDEGLVTASLDHAMWFHAPARADDWLLYAQESAGISDGRGLGLGRFYDRTGRLVATVAQEGMIRPGRPL
ncbi:acyl-CoA thioesterase [Microbacterium sp. ASV49]|uniref:Acyl-CoA thioesterase II n=1 Tax=Microbacterium candidum TaxID=3041922 RepID=A0ABT7N3N7_9MICO|nr:acyl-CoA thioesterase II [Microbacterium sp. ASV49]MDL9981319.1 acyl-CoA thioesterase II [Microbacterium sp. ASV49]